MEELAEIRQDIGKKIVSLEPSYDKKTHWSHMNSEMKWMANDFDREGKDQKGNAKKVIRMCKKHLDEKKQLKVKHKKVIFIISLFLG
jgi:uncharacterized protein YxeA